MQEKNYFFYFTHPLLQNTHISLSILYIYLIKYSLFLHFLLFPSLFSLELSHRPNTNPKSPTPSHRLLRRATDPTQTQNHPHPASRCLLRWATDPTQTQNHPHLATNHHQWSNRTNLSESLTFIMVSHQWMHNPPSTWSIPSYCRFRQTHASCPRELRHGIVSGSSALWFACWDRIGGEWDRWDWWPEMRSVDWGEIGGSREKWNEREVRVKFSVQERGEVIGERNKL